ncbi:MAG: ribonuclease H-like domain-containing protein [Candidatus Taylorbacteria bacterium]|nr:ribonuclease H-like domain-containing protein [Candidatus Taylorbacteria bacterium]
MRIITFDIETKNTFQDAGSSDPAALDISVLCLHDSLDDSYKSFLESQFKDLWPILEQADAFVTWNGDHFDIPILNKYYPGDLTRIKSIDLMRDVQRSLGRRLKLDTAASATLGVKKSGNGLDAIAWWKSGEIDKIIKYCIDDVRITRELYDYALANKSIKYHEGGAIKEIRLDTSKWEISDSGAMNCTLPF